MARTKPRSERAELSRRLKFARIMLERRSAKHRKIEDDYRTLIAGLEEKLLQLDRKQNAGPHFEATVQLSGNGQG